MIVLKILAAPVMVIAMVLAALINFLFCVAAVFCNIACVILVVLSVLMFISGTTTHGIVFLILAFLLSPFGIPAIAEWLVDKLMIERKFEDLTWADTSDKLSRRKITSAGCSRRCRWEGGAAYGNDYLRRIRNTKPDYCHNRCGGRFDYVKTRGKRRRRASSAYECDPLTADADFFSPKQNTKLSQVGNSGRDADVLCIRSAVIQPGEITPEEANRVVMKRLAWTKGSMFFSCDETDRAHIHNHINYNSTRWTVRIVLDFIGSARALGGSLTGMSENDLLLSSIPSAQQGPLSSLPGRGWARSALCPIRIGCARSQAALAKKPADFDAFLRSWRSPAIGKARARRVISYLAPPGSGNAARALFSEKATIPMTIRP
jgi:hypothetical protein